MRRLIMGAHFDDAVLSCWRAITDSGDDVRVTVATVFAGRPAPGTALGEWDRACGETSSDQAWHTRVAEDVQALTGTGAHAVHLPFLDDQYRTGPTPEASLTQAITELVEAADEIWIPVGAGAHPDHLLVAEIALAAANGRRRQLYADLPYAAAAAGWSALVGAATRAAHDDASLRAQLECSTLAPTLTVPTVVELSLTEQEAKRAAVQAYRTQVDPLVAAFGRWFEDASIAPYELHWTVGAAESDAALRRDRALLTGLLGQSSEHREILARIGQENEEATRELNDSHQRELAALRAHHAFDIAATVEENTRLFEDSTSWRLTGPVRALGRLRIRLAERRRPEADEPVSGAAPVADPAAPVADPAAPVADPAAPVAEEPSAGAGLRPPADPGVHTWPAAQFNELYEQHSDPWGYSTRWYEQRKYGITLACLPLQRYRRTFEPGCSVGVLSELLAVRTEQMICADFAPPALVHAKKRLAAFPHVDVRLIAVPTEWPEGTFDLIVISEMATYLSDDDLTVLVERTIGALDPDGALVLVHYRPNTGTPHTAAEVHDRFRQHPQLDQFATHQEDAFLLDVFRRRES